MTEELSSVIEVIRNESKDTQEVVRSLATTVSSLVAEMKAERGNRAASTDGNGKAQGVQMPIFISILGGVVVVASFVIGVLGKQLDDHIKVSVDLVNAQQNWQQSHDRRVLSLNTAQSHHIDQQAAIDSVLWSKVFPHIAYPQPQPAPRLEP